MPAPDLENELRSAFTRAAADFGDPQRACHRLTQRDFHPGGGRRRLAAGITAAAASAAVVLGLGLSGVFGSSPAHATRAIRTAAFTLTSYSDGTATLSLHPGELLNPSQLQSDFAQYGIPAKVTSGSYCTSDPEPAGFSQAVTGPGGGNWTPQDPPTMTIDPSQIPSGTELSVGYFPGVDGGTRQQANMSLINTDSYTCSTTPPNMTQPDTSNQDFGLIYGGPGPSRS
jgi:hypothetical protein